MVNLITDQLPRIGSQRRLTTIEKIAQPVPGVRHPGVAADVTSGSFGTSGNHLIPFRSLPTNAVGDPPPDTTETLSLGVVFRDKPQIGVPKVALYHLPLIHEALQPVLN